MIGSFKTLILGSLCVIFSTNVFSQNIAIKTRTEDVLIQSDTTFLKQVSVYLKKSDGPAVYPIFYDAELETITDVQLYIKKGKRFKLLEDIVINEEDVQLDYISSKKIKSIFIPSDSEVKITYTLKCDELMYLSDFHFFSNEEIDTLKYQITVPDAFLFTQNIIHKDSLPYVKIDSINSIGSTKWYIEAIPVKVAPDPFMYFGIYKNIKGPLMRTLVIPKSYENNHRKYMNDWYFQKLKTRRGLTFEAINKIDELTQGITDPKKIIDTLYNYVRTNFKYVAVEIGMGAFVPSHVNEVFKNKEGDCKDLSNFLCEALNYKGIKSDVALAATYHHISDCDFPSLSSANHVVCIAYLGGEKVILDPTDPIHIPKTPVQSIQDRSILIVNESGGEYYRVPNFSPKQNQVNYKIALEADSDQMVMKGNYKAVYGGISGNFLKRELFYASNNEFNNVVKKHYEFVFGKQPITNLKIVDNEGIIGSEGILSLKSKIFKDSNKRLLFIDFLPKIIESEERETLLEGMHLGSPFSKKVYLQIRFDRPFEMFEPIEHTISKNGISLDLKIFSPSEYIIECNYEFLSDHFIMEKENLDSMNEVLTAFKEITNEPIIFQSKS